MKPIKPFMFSTLYHLKYFDLLRRLHKNRVTILMYHRFSDKAEPFKIQQSVFENQIKFMLKRYNFITLKNYAEILNRESADYPKNATILTIDDGYWDNYIFAYPVLKKYSIPATIFLTTDFITHKAWLWSNKLEYILRNSEVEEFDFPLGRKTVRFRVNRFETWHRTQLMIFEYLTTVSEREKNEYLDELAKHLKIDVPSNAVGDFQPLTWAQVREMFDNGIDFGSHTCSHPILSQLTQRQMEYEIAGSKKEIEGKIHCEISLFSYPNGQIEDITDDVIKVTKNAGYSCAVTTIRGFNNVINIERFMLKRLSVSSDNEIMLSKELAHIT